MCSLWVCMLVRLNFGLSLLPSSSFMNQIDYRKLIAFCVCNALFFLSTELLSLKNGNAPHASPLHDQIGQTGFFMPNGMFSYKSASGLFLIFMSPVPILCSFEPRTAGQLIRRIWSTLHCFPKKKKWCACWCVRARVKNRQFDRMQKLNGVFVYVVPILLLVLFCPLLYFLFSFCLIWREHSNVMNHHKSFNLMN